MGWSHSVLLAQAAHEHILHSHVGLDPAHALSQSSSDFRIDRLRFAAYIDDLCLFGTDKAELLRIQDHYVQIVESLGFPVKLSKLVRPSCDGAEVVGLLFTGHNHTYGLAPGKLEALVSDTWDLIDRRQCTGTQLASIVGKWTWAALVNRPALSVFNAVYRFVQTADWRLFEIWPSVRKELITMASLAPLLFVHTDSRFLNRAVATDASPWGLGVTIARISQPQQTDAALASGVPDGRVTTSEQAATVLHAHSIAEQAHWRPIVAARWRRPLHHINEGEARAVSTAVRWAVSKPAAIASKLLVYCDSTAVVGALTKGRSSSTSLLPRLRNLSARLLSASLRLSVVWIPSKANPADGPSRLWSPRVHWWAYLGRADAIGWHLHARAAYREWTAQMHSGGGGRAGRVSHPSF